MTQYTIKNASAVYTGGGIYIYYGELENGSFFRADDISECVTICNADTSTEEANYSDFYEVHEIETLTDSDGRQLFNQILLWVLLNEPRGNYLASELENRFLHIGDGNPSRKCIYRYNNDIKLYQIGDTYKILTMSARNLDGWYSVDWNHRWTFTPYLTRDEYLGRTYTGETESALKRAWHAVTLIKKGV